MFLKASHFQALRLLSVLCLAFVVIEYFGYEERSIKHIYFILLRILVCITALMSFLQLTDRTLIIEKSRIEIVNHKSILVESLKWMSFLYIITVIVFNPIIPFRFSKTTWLIIDSLTAIFLFIHSAIEQKKKRVHESLDKKRKDLYSQFEDISEYIKTDKKDEKN